VEKLLFVGGGGGVVVRGLKSRVRREAGVGVNSPRKEELQTKILRCRKATAKAGSSEALTGKKKSRGGKSNEKEGREGAAFLEK